MTTIKYNNLTEEHKNIKQVNNKLTMNNKV